MGVFAMLIVREIFTARPGQASKLAKLFKKAMGTNSKLRIMTDVVGDYNTVVIEGEVENLAEFESGKLEPEIDPQLQEEMSKYTEMYLTGRREVFRVLD